MAIFAIHSLIRSLQSTGKWGFCNAIHTDTHTTDGHRNLETESAQWADSLKILHAGHHSTFYSVKIGVPLPSNRQSHRTGQLSEKETKIINPKFKCQ